MLKLRIHFGWYWLYILIHLLTHMMLAINSMQWRRKELSKVHALGVCGFSIQDIGVLGQKYFSLSGIIKLVYNCFPWKLNVRVALSAQFSKYNRYSDTKVHVNYCHHLASVVCKLFTFQASSPKPLGQLEPNLAGMFLGWSSTKLLFFVPVGYSTWLPGPIICSDWLKFQRSSSLKLMN